MRKKYNWPSFKTDEEYLTWLTNELKIKRAAAKRVKDHYVKLLNADEQFTSLRRESDDICKTIHHLKYVKGKNKKQPRPDILEQPSRERQFIPEHIFESAIQAVPIDTRPALEITEEEIASIRKSMSSASTCKGCSYENTILCNICNGYDRDEILANDLHMKEMVDKQLNERVDLPK